MDRRLARLNDLGDALAKAGYRVGRHELAGQDGLLAETPYALLACVEAGNWKDLDSLTDDAQAALTKIATQLPSARRWDLYLLVHVLAEPTSQAEEALAEEIEGDTRYVRKFVRHLIEREPQSIDRALRPFLPLREPTALIMIDPIVALRDELRDLQLPEYIAAVALNAFEETQKVEVP